MNFNTFLSKMQFMDPNGDTLVISKPEEIDSINLNNQTFFYEKGYYEIIAQSDSVTLVVLNKVEIDEIVLGALGVQTRTANIVNFDSYLTPAGWTKFDGKNDISVQKEIVYSLTRKNGLTVSASIPVAVISSDDKIAFCTRLGAKGAINRKRFSHWGMLPHWKDTAAYGEWLKGARAFGAALWEVVGSRQNPRIVFEHPGEDTVPTSIFVCDTGGMVVICAGTSGYNAVADLRYLWMRQKRFQGSHFANDDQARALNDLVAAGKVDPCLSETFTFEQIPHVHQLMHENRHPPGNMACLVNSPRPGLRDVPR